MTEAIFTLGVFAVPMLVGAIAEQRKAEKERMVQEIDRILEQEKQKREEKSTYILYSDNFSLMPPLCPQLAPNLPPKISIAKNLLFAISF